MARPTRFPVLSADEARVVLRWLHATGQVTSAQIRGALAKRETLVQEIRAELERLGKPGEELQRIGRLERRFAKRPRPAPTVAQQSAWRAQGRYLAAVRRLSKAERAKVKAIRERKGLGAALAAARRFGR